MNHAAVEFSDYRSFRREPVEGNVAGISQRIIRGDEEGGYMARIIEYEPGTDTTPNGVQRHDYHEEIFILEGSITDLILNQTFASGSVASRPPNMPHGPWYSKDGCVMYEVRFHPD